jgi:hypothetical protein
MTELVEQDQIGAAHERGDHAQVREVAAAEDDGVFRALERRELALEAGVERVITVDEPR